ncbi:uncharacterized protein ZBAI_03562 [Zygosaccharomyces bailii ISA1307]|nr:uncharacterized protein ZBAI_03562 [Zygosaccharomyces bailii ISA1307]
MGFRGLPREESPPLKHQNLESRFSEMGWDFCICLENQYIFLKDIKDQENLIDQWNNRSFGSVILLLVSSRFPSKQVTQLQSIDQVIIVISELQTTQKNKF